MRPIKFQENWGKLPEKLLLNFLQQFAVNKQN
jgi:hypothetical protein